MSMLSYFRNETPAEGSQQVVVECFVLVASDQQGVIQGCITFDPTRVALGSRYYTGLLGNLEISAEKGTKLKAFLKVPGFEFISTKDTNIVGDKLEHFFEFGENVSCIPFWLKRQADVPCNLVKNDVDEMKGYLDFAIETTQEVIAASNLKLMKLENYCRGIKRKCDPCDATGKCVKLRRLQHELAVEEVEEILTPTIPVFFGRIFVKAKRLLRRRMTTRRIVLEEVVSNM